jgi:hypothetical protein
MTYEQYVEEVFKDHHDCMGLDSEETEFLMKESTFQQRERWLKRAGYNLVSMYNMDYPAKAV